MGRVMLVHVFEAIVHLDGAEKFEVAFCNVPVFGIRGADLDQTVEIAFIDEANDLFSDPLEP